MFGETPWRQNLSVGRTRTGRILAFETRRWLRALPFSGIVCLKIICELDLEFSRNAFEHSSIQIRKGLHHPEEIEEMAVELGTAPSWRISFLLTL